MKMMLFGIILCIIIFCIGLILYINKKVNAGLIKDYGYLATLNSVWSTTHGYSNIEPWNPYYVKIINNKTYKDKRYVTYMELDSGEERTCELAHFLSYFTYRHA